MFLDVIRRRNPKLVVQAIALHQAGAIPANSYVIDLDAVEANARVIREAADRRGLKVFAMTKQMGRSPSFCASVQRGTIGEVVAVDMADARACREAGLRIGHIGHLVQIPRAEADVAASFSPRYWTVFNLEKAREAAAASARRDRRQDLLARIQTAGDRFYRGHEGGFEAADVAKDADRLDALAGACFAGITTFPALLYDPATRKVAPTPNLKTLEKAAEALAASGRSGIEINAPGTTSSVVLDALADAGATQVEPGHGLTGTTPLHAAEDLPELPAVVYLSEVSHHHGGEAYCFGGGLYIDPVFPDYRVKAIVSREPTVSASALRRVEIPPPAAIDYYGMIDTESGTGPVHVGDSVVFGFRPQAFVTRAYVVGLSGVEQDRAEVAGISDATGRPAAWPMRGAL
jgi:predicted amino acid racemase